MEQSELKTRLKEALKNSGLNYDWLADKLGVTKCTVNNYMAKREIPKAQFDNMEQVLLRLEASDYSVISESPVKKKRHRRTNEQIRKDNEASKLEGQAKLAEDGFVDPEEENEKWRAALQKGYEEYKAFFHDMIEQFHTRGLLDMRGDSSFDVDVKADAMVYRIAIPSEIVAIYRKEVKELNEYRLPKEVKVTIPTLIARAITEDALALVNADRPFYDDKLQEWHDKCKALKKAEESIVENNITD